MNLTEQQQLSLTPDDKTLITKFLLLLFAFLCLNLQGQNTRHVITYYPVISPPSAADTLKLAAECAKRRVLLSKEIKDGIILMNHNDDTRKNFYYLTGWSTAPSYSSIDLSNLSLTLFIPKETPQAVIWNGKQAGEAEARALGAKTQPYFDFKKYVRGILKDGRKIYLLSSDKPMREILKPLITNREDSSRLIFIDAVIHEMRVIKSDYEIENIRKAIAITSQALDNAVKTAKPNMYEFEIAALFNFEYTRNGTKESFPSICGSGVNSTALHYEKNNRKMLGGDVLLMDVGAEYGGYAADITRTIPVNGRFSKPQLELYELVLKAQEEAIKQMKPGKKFMDFHHVSSDIIVRGLYKMGLITDTTKQWQKNVYILYRAGHYLGLDVHDAGRYEEGTAPPFKSGPGRDLLPGMVITVEPGIYINPLMLSFIYDMNGALVPKSELDEFVKKVTPAFKRYANIGIRIEDDILITENGNEILTRNVPKQPADIERLMMRK